MAVSDDDPEKTQLDDGNIPVTPRFVDGGETRLVVHGETDAFALLVQGPGVPAKEFKLKQGENTLGRDKKGDVFLDDPSVSRSHATILVVSKVVSVRDLGSKNGTYVKGQKINYEVEILPGTEVRFGAVRTILSKKGT